MQICVFIWSERRRLLFVRTQRDHFTRIDIATYKQPTFKKRVAFCYARILYILCTTYVIQACVYLCREENLYIYVGHTMMMRRQLWISDATDKGAAQVWPRCYPLSFSVCVYKIWNMSQELIGDATFHI